MTLLDNQMRTKADIMRFINGLISTVIRGTNVDTLCDMAFYAGPTFWTLCCLNHDEFAARFHLGRYKGIEDDKLSVRLRTSNYLRARFIAFRGYWCMFAIDTPRSIQHQWLNMKGEAFSPNDDPSVMRQCRENPYEYMMEWYDGKGHLDRRVFDSKGAVVQPNFGFPCSVVSRDYVVDQWSAWDETVDDYEIFEQHAAQIDLRYQYRDGKVAGTVTVYPDSEEERRSFIESGYALTHPLVKRSLPHLYWDLEQHIEPYHARFSMATLIDE